MARGAMLREILAQIDRARELTLLALRFEREEQNSPDPHLPRPTTGGLHTSSDDDGAKSDVPHIVGQGGDKPASMYVKSEHQDASAAQDRNEPVSASGAAVTNSPETANEFSDWHSRQAEPGANASKGVTGGERAATNPVANAGEGANGAIAAASIDPASRGEDVEDRRPLASLGIAGEGEHGSREPVSAEQDHAPHSRAMRMTPLEPRERGGAQCSIEGCHKPCHGRGWCGAHYRRWLKHGDPLGGGTSPGEPERYLREIVMAYEGDECMPWPYARYPDGYGNIWRNGRSNGAHRVICELAHGSPPTKKHYAAHSCGMGHEGCVNPQHIRWATPAENVADKIIHGTHNQGERCGAAKLNEKQVREIYALKGKHLQREIAEQYGIATFSVSQIHRGRKWAHLKLAHSARPSFGFTINFGDPE